MLELAAAFQECVYVFLYFSLCVFHVMSWITRWLGHANLLLNSMLVVLF